MAARRSVAQRQPEGRERTPIDYHDVMCALSKARAARCLAEAVADDDLAPRFPTRYQDDRGEMLEWMRSFAFDALDEALDEAEAAFRKSLTADEALRQIVGRE